MAYEYAGKLIETDEEGYVKDSTQWSPGLAAVIAAGENIELGEDHWAVVDYLRRFYGKYGMEPAVRLLVKKMRELLGSEKGSSKYLYQLFPEGPVRQGSKIAGLPKPASCI